MKPDGAIEIGQRQRQHMILGANADVTGRFAGLLALACLGGDQLRPRQRTRLTSHHHRQFAGSGPERVLARDSLQTRLEIVMLRPQARQCGALLPEQGLLGGDARRQFGFLGHDRRPQIVGLGERGCRRHGQQGREQQHEGSGAGPGHVDP